MSTSRKWAKEKKVVRAMQLAFDVGDEINHQIRLEALQQGLSPPDRIRQILGLPINRKPVRPRLSISLSESDFAMLAEKFDVTIEDKLRIRQLAAQKLIDHTEANGKSGNSD